MSGLTPIGGKNLILNLVYKGSDVNRGTKLEVGLFTNVFGLDVNSVLTDITELSTAGGYARKDLVDATWVVSAGGLVYPPILFSAAGANFNAPIYGYFIVSTGTSPVLLHFEVDSEAPVTVFSGLSYTVDLSSSL